MRSGRFEGHAHAIWNETSGRVCPWLTMNDPGPGTRRNWMTLPRQIGSDAAPQKSPTSCNLSRFSFRPERRRSCMPMILRYTLAAFIMLVAAISAISPFASTFVEQWSRRDIELRSNLVFNSVRDELSNLLAIGATAQIEKLFDRLAPDARLLAVGFCDREGSLGYRSKRMPANFSCEKVARTASASFSAAPASRTR